MDEWMEDNTDDGKPVLAENAHGTKQVQRDPPPRGAEVECVAIALLCDPRFMRIVQREHHPEARAEAQHERLDGDRDEARDTRLELTRDDFQQPDDERSPVKEPVKSAEEDGAQTVLAVAHEAVEEPPDNARGSSHEDVEAHFPRLPHEILAEKPLLENCWGVKISRGEGFGSEAFWEV
jgi:hypothetical protein